jgi:hypothetical protein
MDDASLEGGGIYDKEQAEAMRLLESVRQAEKLIKEVDFGQEEGRVRTGVHDFLPGDVVGGELLTKEVRVLREQTQLQADVVQENERKYQQRTAMESNRAARHAHAARNLSAVALQRTIRGWAVRVAYITGRHVTSSFIWQRPSLSPTSGPPMVDGGASFNMGKEDRLLPALHTSQSAPLLPQTDMSSPLRSGSSESVRAAARRQARDGFAVASDWGSEDGSESVRSDMGDFDTPSGGGGQSQVSRFRQSQSLKSFKKPGAPRLFLSDGAPNPGLRHTIRNAIRVSRFDSVSTILASAPPEAGGGGRPSGGNVPTPQSGLVQDRDTMVSMPVSKNLKKIKKGKKGKTGDTTKGMPVVYNISDAGFAGGGGQAVAAGPSPHTNGSSKPKPKKEICFACWSANKGMTCEMHEPTNPHMIRAQDSALMCNNWVCDILRRRYRAEEIQEVFAKQESSLRYDKTRKQFVTVVEARHPIYRAVQANIAKVNFTMERKLHVRSWFRSFIENLRAGNVAKAKQSSAPAMLKFKIALTNNGYVRRYTKQCFQEHPLPPVTKILEDVPYDFYTIRTKQTRFEICVDPEPPNRMLIHAPIPKPVILYNMREYVRPAPRVCAVPDPAFQSVLPTPIANKV